MKTIRYTLLMLLACLSLNSCQDVEEPANTVPTVVTDVVEKYSGNFATSVVQLVQEPSATS